MCIARSLQASYLYIYSIDDESGASQSGKGHENAETTASPFQERGRPLYVAMFRSRSQSSESKAGWARPKCEEILPKEESPCSHIYSCAWCSSCCLCYQPSFKVIIAQTNVPLRKGLVTPDMPSFTSSASFSRFRMTLASRTRAVGGHLVLAQVPRDSPQLLGFAMLSTINQLCAEGNNSSLIYYFPPTS